jgi:hypothetical protein
VTVTPTKLRENLFSLLDEVIETGQVLDVKRKGHILHIVPEKKVSKLNRIIGKKITNATDNELINTHWEDEWKPFI